ncbi:MAG: GNAT family N-acetyltransferase [Saprospiraceae bacterium]|nr:GNAT family N-acetyltransferase [Saprospiraceae bacterium]
MLCKFRLFQPGDEPELQRMVAQFYLEDAAGGPMNREKVRLTINALGKHSTAGAILMAEGETGILGYAIIIHYWSNEFGGWLAFLDELFIDQPYRGIGLGTRFIEFIMQEYGKEIIGIGLEVAPNNTQALQLYQRLGFESDGYHHLLYLKK